MSRPITVVAAGVRCGKTRRLLDRYRRVQSGAAAGVALWIAPTHRASAAVREQILGSGLRGCLNPHCLTFDQLARRVLEASSLPMRPLSLLGQRQLLADLVQQALKQQRLEYFGAIADTPGFLDLLVGFIKDLKRLEIWPHELRAAQAEQPSPKDRELYELYDRYQRVLNEHHLYDAEGRFWSARARLREGQTQPLASIRHVFVDGFIDFTRTEHEMLEILAGRVESMTISLPLEVDSPRTDLFAKSAATLAELKRRHGDLVVEDAGQGESLWPALAHVERFLFANPRTIAPEPAPEGIEIMAAAGTTGEIELLARRIKSMLVDGMPTQSGALEQVKPSDVLVVFRSLEDSTVQRVQQVFGEYGVPVAVAARPRLERAPIARALAAWLELDADDWPFRRLLAILTHNFFRPAWPEWQEGRAALAAEYVVRRLQVPAGRAAWLGHVEHLASRQNRDEKQQPQRHSTLGHRAQLASPLLNRIAAALDALPQRATPTRWASAATALANDTGMLKSGDDPLAGASAALADQRAWDQVIAALDQSQRLSTWLGRPDPQLSRREFLDLLKEVLRSVPLSGDYDEAGRVRVLPAESARHVTAPYVFVAGLSERAFPPPARESCLYGESETRKLVAAGLPLVLQPQRRSHEMLLFYQLVTRATRRLVLSYSALDEAAQPLSPSPYLSEIERVFASHKILRSAAPNLSAVPPSDEVYSLHDLRVRAVDRALEGETRLLAQLVDHPAAAATARNVLAGVQSVESRAQREAFGPFEGMVVSEAACAVLAQRFSAARCWSPSQLEQYAACPFQFFAQRVLELEPIEEPALVVNYSNRGRMLHWLLAALHRQLNDQAGEFVSPGNLTIDQFSEAMRSLTGELVSGMKSDRPLANGLLEIDVRRMAAALANYHQQHARYDTVSAEWDEPLRPAHFEVSFGPRHGDDPDTASGLGDSDDPLSTGEPFELDCGGQTIRFAGRIDRIDVGRLAGQAVFAIIDYKSGRSESAKADAIFDGTALQLPLYALAAEQLLAGHEAVAARIAYWHVAGRGCKEAVDLHDAEGGKLRSTKGWRRVTKDLPARVASLVRGIRHGDFPMASIDERCTSHCPYSTVCRVNQVRSLDKHWQPPREERA